jgi:probable biosynthetic protein (TIGR04099 family)
MAPPATVIPLRPHPAEPHPAEPHPAEAAPYRHDAPYDGMAAAIILGMPQLCLGGLSETWLLKDIGHRHWTLLAQAIGQSLPDFADENGTAIHAAFNAVSLREGDLRAARANEVLTVEGELTRLSNTQFRSLHRVATGGRLVAKVEVVSIFVRRLVPGVNRSVAAAAPLGLPPLIRRLAPAGFVATAGALRGDRWTEHFGLRRAEAHRQARLVIDPCPSQDFNGVGFLYCANFQAFVDRAEWAFFRISSPSPTTTRRDIIYRGNIEVGDRVSVTLMAAARDDRVLVHWCRLERDGTGETLADIFTERALRPS